MTAEISTRQEVKLRTKHANTMSLIMDMGEKKSFTLIYFDIRGRAEPIRILFALAGVKYIDRRLSKEEWPEMKASK